MTHELPAAVPKVYADFNGLFDGGKVLCLSHGDSCRDESGAEVQLHAGMIVTAYDVDEDERGVRDDLIATGIVQPSPNWLRCRGSRWVLMIDERGQARIGFTTVRLATRFAHDCMHMDDLDIAIREFTPKQDNWLPLEQHLERAFGSSDPKQYYHAIFNLFERFPDEDGAGVFWSALHGMEAVGDYEGMLVQYFRRWPSLMTRTMLRRVLNSGQSHIGPTDIASLIGS